MASEMDDFLGAEGSAVVVDPPAVEPAADTGGAGDGGKPPVTDAASPTPPVETPAAAEPPDEVPEDVRGLRAALGAERSKRNDYKSEAARLAGELTATKAALDAASKAAPAAPVVAAAPAVAPAASAPAAAPVPRVMPNPIEDPQGFARHLAEERFNDVLNISESSLRRAVKNDADVDAKVAAFKGAVAANPSLYQQMRRQPDPYQYVYDQGAKLLAAAEIGDDPAAYRARVEAEIRASLAAEAGPVSAPAAGPVALNLPRSLAGAPSSAPRMQAVAEAMPFESIFEPRKRA